jgi:hypothetical protein
MMTKNAIANQLGFEKIVAWTQSIVDGLIGPDAACATEGAEGRELDTARSARLFAQALQENSNLELDWLWYAANMSRDIERRYCLQRALEINPHSSLASSALAKLPSIEPGDEGAMLLSAASAPAYEGGSRA